MRLILRTKNKNLTLELEVLSLYKSILSFDVTELRIKRLVKTILNVLKNLRA